MQKYKFKIVVIGGGVIGLAIARKLTEMSDKVLLLEKEARYGLGISSRSSEVIHSGIYYDHNTLKARLCTAGKNLLYRYCETKSVPFKKTGKIIVATNDAETSKLVEYFNKGTENGVNDLGLLSAAQVRSMEPALAAVAGLYSPSTGIVDSHGLMTALLHDFETDGGMFVANSPVLEAEIGCASGTSRLIVGVEDPCLIEANCVINAAGLAAQAVARNFQGFPFEKIPPLHYAIGHYYSLSANVPFQRLIYPIATAGGLGIHLTLDLAGNARFGPDVSWRNTEDYSFDDSRRLNFIEAIRTYWPTLPAEKLSQGYTGIRPKLWGIERPNQDFVIQTPEEHGVPGVINLFGIESPGLTASLAIADHVAAKLDLLKPRSHAR